MEIVYVLSIFYIGTVLGAPLKNINLYDAIVHDCPEVKNNTNLTNLKLFSKCSNLKLRPQQQQQENLTRNDVLCLLFYNTFNSYCSKTQNITTSLPADIYSKYNINTLCDNVAILTDLPQTTPANQQLANLKALLDTKKKCMEICNAEDSILEIEPVCSLSYYYGHLIETKTTIIEQNIHLETNPPNKGENHQQTSGVKHDKTTKRTQIEDHQQTTSVKPKNPQEDQSITIQKLPTKPIKKPTSTSSEQTSAVVNVKQNNQERPPVASGEMDKQNTGNQRKPPASTGGTNEQISPSQEKPLAASGANDKQITSNQVKPPVASGEIQQSSTEKVMTTELAKNELPTVIDNDVIENTVAETGGQQQPPQNNDLEIDQEPNEHVDSDEDTDVVDDLDTKELAKTKDTNNNNNNNKPNTVDESEAAVDYPTEMDGDSYFFSYFMMLCIIFIVGYICYHNKQKILALILEGRRGKRQYRSRRPNSANYHKLDSNLEEAITSTCNKNTSNVIY